MLKNTSNKTLEQAFEEFIKYCKIKNLSNQSILHYQYSFDKFIGFVGDNQAVKSITKDVVGDYILYLKEDDNINDVTINTYLRGLRAILYYFMRLGYMDKFKIQLIKAEKKAKQVYTDEELEILLTKPNMKKCSFTEYRNWVLINFLLGTGARISTVANVLIGDIDFENDFIRFTKTKNKRQQLIPMSTSLKAVLIEYLQIRGGDETDYLFCNEYGQGMTTDGLKQAVKRYNRSRGVMRTSCHAFRHTFAKKYILAGGDMFRLQKILNHSSLDMVREYVDMFASDLQKDFDTFNPLDQLIGNKTPITMRGGGRR